jgi:hypothetical protein
MRAWKDEFDGGGSSLSGQALNFSSQSAPPQPASPHNLELRKGFPCIAARRIFDAPLGRHAAEQHMGDLLSLRIHHALDLARAAGPTPRSRAASIE